ncbi:hypothetical protein HYC85_019561 [Camellia sinensis]|uniref:Glycosyltransferase n=1 Tax=Camellia sinensis TaxID=4442 RepID=A0A7J7GM94_CAMSI|nr:hypothetical protein HYC85_019561 [Camellia sinensis]
MVHKHILLFTYPAQGTINPSIQFAKQLIKLGVKVTIITSLSAHRRMPKTTTTPPGLNFVSFSDGYDDGLKPSDDYQQFLSGLKNQGAETLTQLITSSAEHGNPVTGVVYTMLQIWAAKVAQSFHIPSTLLWTQPAALFRIYFHYFNDYGDSIKNIFNDPSSLSVELPLLPRLTSRDLPSILLPADSDSINRLVLTFKEQIHTLEAEAKPKILVNSFDALEPEALRAIERLKLIAIGPLVPSAFLDGKDPSDTCFGADLFRKSRDYVEWLDLKPESSVVYVSFGTMAVISKKQREEVARGLLESHRPFLWVMRATKNGEKEEDELSCREELEQLGMIVPWCSQLEVLSHPSLGCFVTHCGWNSSLEGLISGVPMVGFPQFVDQPTNAKLIEDVFKTGVRVIANEDGIVEGEEIKRCIEVIMGGGEKGKEMYKMAKKWRELAKEAAKEGGSLDMNLRAFVDEV